MAEMVDTELRFTEYAIRLDEKNYHAWAHRYVHIRLRRCLLWHDPHCAASQWVLKATKKFGSELEFLERMTTTRATAPLSQHMRPRRTGAG